MRIVAISDTHNQHGNIRLPLPDGDVLVHSGDASYKGEFSVYRSLSDWLMQQPHKHKIFVPGNHDITFESDEAASRACFDPSISILINQSVVIDGLKFYGSPVTPRFFDWAWNVERGSAIRAVWDKIPDDTDVLITHGPSHGWLDRNSQGYPCGCRDLLNRIYEIKPRAHIAGHIHEGFGIVKSEEIGTIFVNASTCTASYKPRNPPLFFDI